MSSVTVVGCGAIGSIVAGHLTLAGADVTVVDPWFRQVEALREGLEITTPQETVRTAVAALHVDEVAGLTRPVDVLLVGVKAYDSALAVGLVRHLLHAGSVVVPLQNGMTEGWFADLVGAARALGCCVHVPAELTAPGRVTRYLPHSRPTLTVGEPGGGLTSRARMLADLLAPVGLVDATDDLPAVQWAKLALNASTNAPAGLTGWTTRRLWADPAHVPLAVRAAGETIAVAEACGVAPRPVFGGLPAELFRAALTDPTAGEEAAAGLVQAAEDRRGRQESRTSLLQDVERGRRTEIRYLNGHVVREGAARGVATPVNAALERLVGEIDRGRLASDPRNLERLTALAGDGAVGDRTVDDRTAGGGTALGDAHADL